MVGGDVAGGAVGLHQRKDAPVAERLGHFLHDAAERLDLVGPYVIEQHARDIREDPLPALGLGQRSPLRLVCSHESRSFGFPVILQAFAALSVGLLMCAARWLRSHRKSWQRTVSRRTSMEASARCWAEIPTWWNWGSSRRCGASTARTSRAGAFSRDCRRKGRASCRGRERTPAWSTSGRDWRWRSRWRATTIRATSNRTRARRPEWAVSCATCSPWGRGRSRR